MNATGEHSTPASPRADLALLVEDLDEMEDAIAALPMRIRRLASRGTAGFRATQVGSTGVLAGSFGFPVLTEGEVDDGYYLVALQIADFRGHWNGEDLDADRAFVYRPGAEHVGVGLTDPDGEPAHWLALSVPATSISGGDPRRGGGSSQRVVADEAVQALRRTAIEVLTAPPDSLDAGQRSMAEREIVELVAGLNELDGLTRTERSSAAWIVERCLEAADQLGPMPSTSDLSAAVGVTDRWVRAAFRARFGVSTMTFLRSRALDGARRDLLAAHRSELSVTDVAMRWGFWHLGRFSATYRAHFGELPSVTLDR